MQTTEQPTHWLTQETRDGKVWHILHTRGTDAVETRRSLAASQEALARKLNPDGAYLWELRHEYARLAGLIAALEARGVK